MEQIQRARENKADKILAYKNTYMLERMRTATFNYGRTVSRVKGLKK